MRLAIVVLLSVVSILATAPTAFAQVLYGSLVGTVTDQSAAVVPNAQVKAVKPAIGETRAPLIKEKDDASWRDGDF